MNEDIFVKFGTLVDIGYLRVTVGQYLICGKIQDGSGRHLEFDFSVISRLQVDIFASNLVCRLILDMQRLLCPNISHF